MHRSSRRVLVVAVLLVAVVASAVPAAQASSTPVMQRDRLSAAQLAAWYEDHRPAHWTYRASVPIHELARYYIEEGRAEGVAGDLAFAQAVLETAYFHYPSAGQVRPSHNNFAGLGACDGGTCTVARWPTARLGVRGQIHHLRAYADRSVTASKLANPLQSPRFHLVAKGSAPTWERMGNGRWATDPNYASKILNLYGSMVRHARQQGGPSGTFTDVAAGSTHADAIEALATSGVTQGCSPVSFCPRQTTTRAQMASFLVRALSLAPSSRDRFTDVSGTHREAVNTLAAHGITLGCGRDRYCPDDPVTRGEMASFLARALDLPAGTARFGDVAPTSSQSRAVGAVSTAGIAAGFGDGTFRPGDPISRAQMASFLHRAGLAG